uniref:SAWADEE domain-containing protein n=1 Tax=Oryza glumipatula TaxID=40148 RepID=A0A0E0A9T5_9ORYZ
MGRPPTPSTGGPGFRFTQEEVAEMESLLRHLNNGIPDGSLIQSLADRFTASAARAGKVGVRPCVSFPVGNSIAYVLNSDTSIRAGVGGAREVWYWFQNRKYSQRSRNSTKMLPAASGDHKWAFARSSVQKSVKNSLEGGQLEFEAKSVRDGAWKYGFDFLDLELGTTNGLMSVHVCGNVLIHEGKHQALYFDAHVLDAQKRRHDARGCRCRFLVCYDHDDSEEIVPLRKMCRRPETDYRLEILHAAGAANAAKEAVVDSVIA